MNAYMDGSALPDEAFCQGFIEILMPNIQKAAKQGWLNAQTMQILSPEEIFENNGIVLREGKTAEQLVHEFPNLSRLRGNIGRTRGYLNAARHDRNKISPPDWVKIAQYLAENERRWLASRGKTWVDKVEGPRGKGLKRGE